MLTRCPIKAPPRSSPHAEQAHPPHARRQTPRPHVTWHDGEKHGAPNKPERHPDIPEDTFKKATSGMMFIGTDGVIFEDDPYCKSPVIYPLEKYKAIRAQQTIQWDKSAMKVTNVEAPNKFTTRPSYRDGWKA